MKQSVKSLETDNEAPAEQALISASLPVTSVTVLEDRAMIKRTGMVDLKSQFGKYVVENVSPVISDTSLKVSVKSIDSDSEPFVKVADCTISRALRILKEDLDKEYAALCEKIEDNDDRLQAMTVIINLMEEEAELNSSLLEKTLEEASDDVRWGRMIDPFLGSNIEGLEAELTEMAGKRISLSNEQDDLAEKKDDLLRQLRSVSSPSSVKGASIEFQLLCDESGCDSPRQLEVTVEYMVPGACWRPRHEASFGDDGSASFSSSGCVWQNTGEDWDNISLLLSTERPSLGTSAPLLEDDLLSLQKKQERKVELRETKVSSLNVSDSKDDKPSRVQEVEMPGIDDGGAVKLLSSPSPVSIKSDGRPHLVPLSSFSADYERDLVIFPEVSEAAYERVILKNTGKSPLLAGPVYLIKNGSYCGRTSTLYVASEEPFKLGLGTDPSIRCKRSLFRNELEQGMLSRWVSVDYVITLKISSLSKDPQNLLIEERIPVSEIDDVKIIFDNDKTTGGTSGPDKDGKIRWELSLPPQGTKTIKLRYRVEKKADVDIL